MKKGEKDELIDLLVKVIKLGLKVLPDSKWYNKDNGISWVWEECTDEEQEKVKEIRKELNVALEKVFKKKKIECLR